MSELQKTRNWIMDIAKSKGRFEAPRRDKALMHICYAMVGEGLLTRPLKDKNKYVYKAAQND